MGDLGDYDADRNAAQTKRICKEQTRGKICQEANFFPTIPLYSAYISSKTIVDISGVFSRTLEVSEGCFFCRLLASVLYKDTTSTEQRQ